MAKKQTLKKPRHKKDAVVAGSLIYYNKSKVTRAEKAVREENGITDLKVELSADEVLMQYLKLGGYVEKDGVKIPHESWKEMKAKK